MQFMPFFINHNLPHLDSRQTFEKIAHDIAGNIGNAYITYSLARLCGINHHTIQGIGNIWADIENIDKNKADEINSNYSHVVMIMQDQIREHDSYYAAIPFDKINYLIDSIKIPFIVISLGHNSFGYPDYDHLLHTKISSGLSRMLSILSHKCLQLGVRGLYTAEILNHIGINNTAVVGCPSIFSPGSRRDTIRKKHGTTILKLD